MSVRKRNTQTGLSDNTNNTFLEREAAQEAKNDWRQKSRSEKLRLAKAEHRRRKAGRRLLGIKWTPQVLFITFVGLASIVALVYLLSHSSAQKLPVKPVGGGFKIREKKRNPLEKINGKLNDDLPPAPRKAKPVKEVEEEEEYEDDDEETATENDDVTETDDDVPVVTMDPDSGFTMEEIQRQLGL